MGIEDQNGASVDKDDVIRELSEVRKAIDTLRVTFETGLRMVALIPVSVVFCSIFTWLFYYKLITEWVWVPFMLILMFPYFGEGIKSIIANGLFSVKGSRAVSVILLLSSALLLVGCAGFGIRQKGDIVETYQQWDPQGWIKQRQETFKQKR